MLATSYPQPPSWRVDENGNLDYYYKWNFEVLLKKGKK